MSLTFDLPLKSLLKEAWKVRTSNFPRLIKFVKPEETLAVSLTGSSCELNCSHCEGHYLHRMSPVDKELEDKKGKLDKYNSCLISGGSNKDGKVPFAENLNYIEDLWKKDKKINLHPGLVNEEEAKKVSCVDVCSFDFITDDNIINKVYGLKKSARDFINSYNLLKKYAKEVVPHINVGIPGGKEKTEIKTLEILENLEVDAITFIIFTPTRGTEFEKHPPPSLTYVGKVLSLARLKFPVAPIYLGCMRPGGKYRERVDKIALNAGVNKIVSPTPGVKKLAKDKGLDVWVEKECCAL